MKAPTVEINGAKRKQASGPPGQVALPPYDVVALVLQGGGTLGAYQAGVYEGLHEAGIVTHDVHRESRTA